MTDSDAEHLAAAFNIKTVRDLGSNKYFAVAGVWSRSPDTPADHLSEQPTRRVAKAIGYSDEVQ